MVSLWFSYLLNIFNPEMYGGYEGYGGYDDISSERYIFDLPNYIPIILVKDHGLFSP